MPQPTVVLDACVLLNLLASDEAENIIASAAHEYLICEAAAKEVIQLRTTDSEEEAFEVIRVDDLIKAGLLKICTIETQLEESLYVNYAGQVGDGEAMSIAIAEVRGFGLATDDRKARLVFLGAVDDPSRLLYTSDLVRSWAEQENLSVDELKVKLFKIRRRATFFPPKRDPNFSWWMSILNS